MVEMPVPSKREEKWMRGQLGASCETYDRCASVFLPFILWTASKSVTSAQWPSLPDSLLSSLNMDTAASTSCQEIRCGACGQNKPGYDIVHVGSAENGYRPLCSRCLNTEVAKAAGMGGFEHAAFESIGISDCNGEIHEFHFRIRLLVTGIALDAFELRDGNPAGYIFQIIGDLGEDQFVLFGRLVEKMRRALSVEHLKRGENGFEISDQRIVRGRIAWDESQGGYLPLLVIDGREINWDELGHMLMTFEGWQFKLTISDKSEEL
jgi:hypothetical protein